MVPRKVHLPGLERRVQGQNCEAVITREVLLEPSGEGGSLGQSRGFVGTNPGLVIWHLANPTCALVVALTPCLPAKLIFEEMNISKAGEERSLVYPNGDSLACRTQGAGW